MLEFTKIFKRGFILKNLIIVESPTKAKTIKNFLDKSYIVVASKGHIRDLPKNTFGIKIEENCFVPMYRVSKDCAKTVKEIKDIAKSSDNIYIATDEDREGEAIGFHIATAIGKEPSELPRIVFHEITKNAIIKSLQEPKKIDIDKVNAQQARRLLDRIVGYKLSPLLSSKIQRGLSAGRVQSSALKIIVDRDKEIDEFVPIEYYRVIAKNSDLEFNLIEFEGNKLDKMDIKDKKSADKILKKIKKEKFSVENIENRARKTGSPAPFMTSTLQQSSSNILGFSSKKTMIVAQILYEGVKIDEGESGLITYMRTDSLNISTEAIESAREFISKNYSNEYLPKEPKAYKSKSKGAQEAHEAIRPTDIDFTPEKAKAYLKDDELKLYTLIYNRFLASQMEDALFESMSVVVSSNSSKFKITGRKLTFDGFYKVYGDDIDKDKLLPEFKIEQIIKFDSIDATQHFTEPPARYTEASLIKTLEALGVGRPSTYAPTISILQSRGYIEVDKKQLKSTEIAGKVIKLLDEHFHEIVDSGFTAKLEEELDEIAHSNKDWQGVLSDFYYPFIKKIEDGKESIQSQKIVVEIGEKCPECGEELVRRGGRFGEFIACSSYPKCKYTRATQETPAIEEKCEKCGGDMVLKRGRNGEFLACKNYPDCKNTKTLKTQNSIKVEVNCPECGGEIIERNSRRGKFFGCKNYPDCKFISKFLPIDRRCSECNYLVVQRTYRKKEIYECIKCKHKEELQSDDSTMTINITGFECIEDKQNKENI